MDTGKEDESITLKELFGYSEILWEIENFLPLTCKKNWTVQSPEFNVEGPQLTKWRLRVKEKDIEQNHSVWLDLERLQCDPFTGPIEIYWKLFFSYGGDNEVISKKITFEINSSFGIQINDMNIMQSDLAFSEENTFVVQVSILVYLKDNNKILETSKNTAFKSLSQDLTVLYNLRRNTDTMIKLGPKDKDRSLVNKAILCCRNSVLKNKIEKEGEIVNLEFPNINLETFDKLLGYWYTGDLRYILRQPSFVMERAIHYFDIDELKLYFMPNKLKLRTKFRAHEFSIPWKIDVRNIINKDYIESRHIRINPWNMKFYFVLYPNGVGDENEHTSIFLTFLEESEPHEMCLQFAILDEFNNYQKRKCLRRSTDYEGELGFKNFTSTNIFQDTSYVSDEELTIVCRLQIPIGFRRNSVVMSETCLPIFVEKAKHYSLLSKHIGSLFETGNYSDYSIRSGSVSFKVHSVIIYYRSRFLGEMIKNNKTSITLTEIDPSIIHQILHYLYSGTLGNYTVTEILNIYDIAEKWTLLPLKYICSNVLKEELKPENVSKILTAAEKNKDSKLRNFVIKFICSYKRAFDSDSTFELLGDYSSDLYQMSVTFKEICGGKT